MRTVTVLATVASLLLGFQPADGPATASPLTDLLPKPTLVEEVRVDARSSRGSSSIQPLLAGVHYVFVARGLYDYGGGKADAECANLGSTDPTFLPDRFSGIDEHILDITVNSIGIDWPAVQADVNGCNTVDHTYRFIFTPASTGQVVFRVNDTNFKDNENDAEDPLTVAIFRHQGLPPGGTQIDSFTVPSAALAGANSNVSLASGQAYRIVLQGRFNFGATGITHDAECLHTLDGPGQRLDAADKAGRSQDVLLDGNEMDWISPVGLTGCNDDDYTYYVEIIAAADAPVNLQVRDVNPRDNEGLMAATIYEIAAASGQPGVAEAVSPVDGVGNLTFVEEVPVDPRSQSGSSSVLPLLEGVDYVFVASGLYHYGAGKADAECSNLGDVDPTFLPDRFSSIHPHALDILVNGVGIEWPAVQANPDGCNTVDHTYRFVFRAASTSRINFRVNDGNTKDNRTDSDNPLKVTILRHEGLPPGGTLIDSFTIPSAAPGGANSNVSLAAGEAYRIVVQGEFNFGVPNLSHDAECLRVLDGPGDRTELADQLGRSQDVVVDLGEVPWVSTAGLTGCNDVDHTYFLEIMPTSDGSVNLRVRDVNNRDNLGPLAATIYQL